MSYFVSKNGDQELYTHDMGGRGKPLLFVHAATLNGTTWKPVVDGLSADYHCFALDIRAHGLSQIEGNLDLSWSQIADDLQYVVEDIKNKCGLSSSDQIMGCGHSLGAALLLFSQLKTNTFSRLWLFEPVLFSSDTSALKQRTQQMVESAQRRKFEFASRKAAGERFKTKPPFQFFDPLAFEQYLKFGLLDKSDGSGVRLACKPEDEAHIYLTANSGISEQIDQIDIPVKIMVGQDDDDRVASIFDTDLPDNFVLDQNHKLSHFGVQTHPSLISENIYSWFSS